MHPRVIAGLVVLFIVVAGSVGFATVGHHRAHPRASVGVTTTRSGLQPAASTRASASATTAPDPSGARARFIPPGGNRQQVPVDPPKAPVAPSVPVRVQVPSLHISSSLESLGLLSDGTMKPPTLFGQAGWYSAGTRPGAVGPAVIAGHVDSRTTAGIFLELSQVKVGASIFVTTKTHQKYRFVVTDKHEYPKTHFPTNAVYGPTPVATLHLITCTGKFNRATRHYLDDLVVTSVLA